MRKDEKDLFDLIIQCRMQVQYERRTKEWKDSRERSLEIADKYQAVVESLPPEQAKVVKAYEEDVFDFSSREGELFYRAGLEDGIRLNKVIRRMKKAI